MSPIKQANHQLLKVSQQGGGDQDQTNTVNQNDPQEYDWEKEFHLVEPDVENDDLRNPLNFIDTRVCISNHLDLHDDVRLSLTNHYQRELFVKNQLKKVFLEKQEALHSKLSSIWQIFNRSRNNPYVQHLVFIGELSVADTDSLTPDQIRNLVFLKEYIKRQETSASDVLKLDSLKSERLTLLPNDYYVKLSFKQLDQILADRPRVFDQLLRPECVELFNEELLTCDQFVQFPTAIDIFLRSKFVFVKDLYVKGQLDLTEINALSLPQLNALKSLQHIIFKKIITAREALRSPEAASLLTNNQHVRDEIIAGRLTKDEVLKFTSAQISALNNWIVKLDLDRGLVTMEDILGWDPDQVPVLYEYFLRYLRVSDVTAKEIIDKAALLKQLKENDKIFREAFSTISYVVRVSKISTLSPDPTIVLEMIDVIKSSAKATYFLMLDCHEWASTAVSKKLFGVTDIFNLPDEKIALLYEPSVQWAMEQLVLTFEEIRTTEDIYPLLKTALYTYNSRHSENCNIQ